MNASDPNGTLLSAPTESMDAPSAEERQWAMFAHLSAVLMILTIMSFSIGALLTIPLLLLIGIAALVFSIIAGMQANQGTRYRYPVSLRLVK
ncbi:MAG: DUF4870 domain-containing protein [Gammaproteobacteria bacterium]|nr:DUF4870 domain-containing protein [Gammaproteobacteria bacterium]MDH4255535.1 DUF4870 domain-containing protein [Gammaproteobacteria bacterium]